MTLRAVENTSLPDQIFEQLTAEIVSGRYRPRSLLPSERKLTAVFGANRHVVREALKRLEQVGLVRVVQGGGTTVLDFRRTAGLDLLGVVADHPEAFDMGPGLLRSALEMRAGAGADVAALCARRASPDVRGELVSLAERLAVIRTGPSLLAADHLFWQRMLDGADNLAYQLAFNSLLRGVQANPELSLVWLEQELARGDYRRPIAAAITAGRPEAAASAARDGLDTGLPLVAAHTDAATESRSAR
ncbi:MAG: GntR family transcriptional regulator [Actinomycetota bacterium]|nr:GntR family transcriptional regulator [Actinomycetota bacterium]